MPRLLKFLAHLSLATSEDDVDESSSVFEALESAALGGLGLLLGFNLLMRKQFESVHHRLPGLASRIARMGKGFDRIGSYFRGLRLDLACQKKKN